MISGVFEKYPKLKIILGHLGEGIPFLCGASTNRCRVQQRHVFQGHVSQKLLSDHQRKFLRHRPDRVDHGDGHRPHHVLGRLALHLEQDGDRLANASALSAADKSKVFSGNAKALLKL